MVMPIATQAEAAWVADQTVQQQLADGKVAVRIEFEGDPSRIRVQAAVKINASPEAIWTVLTDCDHASSFIPGVKRCRRIESAPDDSWEIIEHEAKFSWFMPAITSVIRTEYKRPDRIDFQRISGDLKYEQGDWVLDPAPSTDDPATIVEYDLHVDPGFWVPRVLLRHSLRSELPAALTALRQRAESTIAKR